MSSHILWQNVAVPWRHLCWAAILKVQKYNLHELRIVALEGRSYHDDMAPGICKSPSSFQFNILYSLACFHFFPQYLWGGRQV